VPRLLDEGLRDHLRGVLYREGNVRLFGGRTARVQLRRT
jgi:hypothetical protein